MVDGGETAYTIGGTGVTGTPGGRVAGRLTERGAAQPAGHPPRSIEGFPQRNPSAFTHVVA